MGFTVWPLFHYIILTCQGVFCCFRPKNFAVFCLSQQKLHSFVEQIAFLLKQIPGMVMLPVDKDQLWKNIFCYYYHIKFKSSSFELLGTLQLMSFKDIKSMTSELLVNHLFDKNIIMLLGINFIQIQLVSTSKRFPEVASLIRNKNTVNSTLLVTRRKTGVFLKKYPLSFCFYAHQTLLRETLFFLTSTCHYCKM